MVTEINLKNKRITVMGLGLHGGGLGTVKWLSAKGAILTVTDLRDAKTLAPTISKIRNKTISFVLGRHRDADFKNVDMVIKNPGVPRDSRFLEIARKYGVPIETDMSLFFRLCGGMIIGVTGTKGKSTTTTLLYEMLKKAGRKPLIAGNIRISPLHYLDRIKKTTPIVLELSSWQLEDMAHTHLSPHISIVTNVLADHLNRYHSMREYAQSKKLIIQFQKSSDVAILNRQNTFTKSFGRDVRGRRYWFSLRKFSDENGCFLTGHKIFFRQNGTTRLLLPQSDIRLTGNHGIEHVMAASVAAKMLHVPHTAIREAVRHFKGVPDRLEFMGVVHGRKIYNDTTATTPDAAIAALDSFPGKKIILIAGGADKKLAYAAFAKKIKSKTRFSIFFTGAATNKIVASLKRIKYRTYSTTTSMKDAVSSAWKHSMRGDIILLSPGAASFGIFLNEFDRGAQFKRYAKQLH